MSDNNVKYISERYFVSAVCRLTTIAALLLHLIFGCSLHHVAACGSHGHDGCQHTCLTDNLPSVQPDDCCGCGHGRSGEAVGPIGKVNQVVAPCCACEPQPCDGNHPGCHGEVECSFVPSSDVVFNIDAPLVAFVSYEHDPMMNFVSSLTTRRLQQRSAIVVSDSLSHCASLCTWII